MNIEWNDEKNDWLKKDGGISFEEIADKVLSGKTLLNAPHHNNSKYPEQYIYVVEVDDYCYMVPYVMSGKSIFLKTIIPSRKMTKKFLGAKDENDR